MIKKALIGLATGFAFALTVSLAGTATAQCSCGDCGGGAAQPIGTDYTQVQSDCDCGDSSCGAAAGCGSDCYGGSGRCDCDVFKKCRYFSAFGGWNGIQTFEQSNITDDTVDANIGLFDEGWMGGFAVGAQVHPRVRYELEVAYRDNDAEGWDIQQIAGGIVTGSVLEAATGNVSATSGMFNIAYDIQPRQAHCWNMYVGGGIGLARTEGAVTALTDTYVVDDTSLAFQALIGLNKGISQRMDFFTEYRYFQASNVDVANTTGSLGSFTYATNSVLFGVRLRR